MNSFSKVAGFTLGLAAVFVVALAVGSAVGPTSVSAADQGPTDQPAGSVMSDPMTGSGANESPIGAMVSDLPGGLMSAQDGYRLQLDQRSVPVGAQSLTTFRILGPDGRPVVDYLPAHDKELHLIVVRRDLTGFQHVHPSRAADGTWSVPLDLLVAGQYRVFADFVPVGHGGITLGADLSVAGSFAPQPLPPPSRTAEVDGYTVTLAGDLLAGQSSELTLSVSRDGVPVTDLQPYLAAYGHLVALRDGDLAYLHVHPAGAPGDSITAAGPTITFYATIPSDGDYGLFLDFQHNGKVRTASFIVHAGPATARAPSNGSAAEPAPAAAESVPGPATVDHGH